MKSKNFEMIKSHYDKGEWTIAMVRNVVGKKLGITKEEFKEITGEDYE